MKKFAGVLIIIASLVFIVRENFESTPRPEVDVQPVMETVQKEEKVRTPPSSVLWKGTSAETVLAELGEPDRMDESAYGYQWWIYGENNQAQFQLGMAEGQVVTGLFFEMETGPELFHSGDTYHQLDSIHQFDESYTIENGSGRFRFELTETDLRERPLISLSDGWSAQLYFDAVTGELSAVRTVRDDFLLKLQPYQLVYRGELPAHVPLKRQEWRGIEEGMEKQILEMTNLLRARHDQNSLLLHEKASEVAFLHSKDMNVNNYFSHFAPNGDGLQERMEKIQYRKAGENIAAQHIDAAAAVYGWLNSEGHREALLDPDYTHIGIGVHQRYYTQNFLTLP